MKTEKVRMIQHPPMIPRITKTITANLPLTGYHTEVILPCDLIPSQRKKKQKLSLLAS